MLGKIIGIFLLISFSCVQVNSVDLLVGTPDGLAGQILNSVDQLDQEFLRTVNNYFGCKIWEDGVCVQCSERFYFNEKGICCEVKQYCQQFNLAFGKCQKCYPGYALVGQNCSIVNLNSVENIGCKTWNGSRCQQCSFRYYFNSNRICTAVDNLCARWENTNGRCTLCYPGYQLSNLNNSCIVDTNNAQFYQINKLCSRWNQRICLACAERSYFDQNGICIPVDDFCETWDRLDGTCLSCYKGYLLNRDSRCVVDPANSQGPSDLGCGSWDWDNKRCLTCSKGFFVNTVTGRCTQVDDLCRTHGSNGACLQCFKGYVLRGRECVIDPTNAVGPSDLFCAAWDWDNQVCLECAVRAVFVNNRCQLVNDACREYDSAGLCTACYKGYALNRQGACIVQEQTNPDLGCALWDWENRVCIQCSQRHYRSAAGNCLPISNDCRTFDNSGNCISCYKGYRVQNGRCAIFQQSVTDLNCALWDWDNQVCLQCASDAYFGLNGKCVTKDGLCRQTNQNNVCISCYKGYILQGNRCVVNTQIQTVKDLLCAEWDWDNQVCLSCAQRARKNANGVCVPLDDLCRTFNAVGNCVQCYKGYALSGNRCLIIQSTRPIMAGCGSWDWQNSICLKCSFRYYFGSNNVCLKVSDDCREYNDISGKCTSCYKGYFLEEGSCIRREFINVKDTLCAEWDWDNQVCLKCAPNSVFNLQGNCAPVSDLCRAHNQLGLCISCYKGYELVGGKCVLAIEETGQSIDEGCSVWDWDGKKCLKCSVRWYFNQTNQKCQQVNDLCNTYNEVTGQCQSCYKGYLLNNGVCYITQNIFCKSFDNTGKCVSCYTGYALYKGECRRLDKLASLALYYAQCCPQKLQQLRNEGRLS